MAGTEAGSAPGVTSQRPRGSVTWPQPGPSPRGGRAPLTSVEHGLCTHSIGGKAGASATSWLALCPMVWGTHSGDDPQPSGIEHISEALIPKAELPWQKQTRGWELELDFGPASVAAMSLGRVV